MEITEDGYAPLREGTRATVRQASLSGIANRYIDLQPRPTTPGDEIQDGGFIRTDKTITAVDLDQLFNTFDRDAGRSLTGVIRGYSTAYGGRGPRGQQGLALPQPVAGRDEPAVRRAQLRHAAAQALHRRSVQARHRRRRAARRPRRPRRQPRHRDRRDRPREGRAGRRDRPAAAVHAPREHHVREPARDARRPRPAGRGVQAGRQAAAPFLAELRPLARDARPTLRDLSRSSAAPARQRPDRADARDIPLRDIAVGPVQANGKEREGAFPALRRRCAEGDAPSSPSRGPTRVDLTGWFDDFSHSGIYDALGGVCRAAPHVNAFAQLERRSCAGPAGAARRGLPASSRARPAQPLPRRRSSASAAWKPTPDYNCDPTQVPAGR